MSWSYAQDCCKSNPKYCKLLSDTAGVKMMVVTLPPGAKLVTHTHPVNFGYCIKGGLFKWTYEATGKTESADMKPGDEFHGGPESSHHSWNAGKTTIQFILVEKYQ
jgi:quercetin dioxygenase-like cupin family protein